MAPTVVERFMGVNLPDISPTALGLASAHRQGRFCMDDKDNDSQKSSDPIKFVDTERLQLALNTVEEAASLSPPPEELPDLPEDIETTIEQIAATGMVYCSWEVLRKCMVHKLKVVVKKQYGSSSSSEEMPLDVGLTLDQFVEHAGVQLGKFVAPPFTVQRLCELLHDPKRWNRTLRIFLSAFDKCLNVTSMVSHGGSNSTANTPRLQSVQAPPTASTDHVPSTSPKNVLHTADEKPSPAVSESRKRRLEET